MSWLQVEQSLVTHRKVQQLAKVLNRGVAATLGHLLAFWLWSLDNCDQERGSLPCGDAWLLEQAALWRGRTGTFVAALLEVGFLHQVEDTLEVHGWEEHQGKVLKARQQAAERQRRSRSRREGVTEELTHNVTATSRVSHVAEESRQDRGQKNRGQETKDSRGQSSVFNKTEEPTAIDEPVRLLVRMPGWPESEIKTRQLVAELAYAHPGVDLAREVNSWRAHIQESGPPESHPAALRGWVRKARTTNTESRELDPAAHDLVAALSAAMDMETGGVA